MNKKPPLFFLGLIIGLVLGGFYFTSGTLTQDHPKPPTAGKPPHPSHSRAQTFNENQEIHSAKINASYTKLTELYGDKLEQQLAEFIFEDAKALVSFILSKSNPLEGLDWKNKNLVEETVLQMARKDLDATCEWIELTFPPESHNNFYEDILKDQFKDQPQEALAFAKEHMDSSGVSDALRHLYSQSKSLDTDTAEFFLKNTEVSDEGSRGSGVHFSKDFDFLRFGNTALELGPAEAEYRQQLSVFPTNFLEEWAKRNPEDAMAFYNQNLSDNNHSNLPFNGIENLVKGYLSTAPDDEASSWLADVLHPDNLSQNDRGNVIIDLTSDKIVSLGVLRETIRKMDLSNEKILDFYSVTTGGGGESFKEGRLLSLRLFPTPQNRIDALSSHYSTPKERFQNQTDNQFNELCLQLKTLGHSEAEINQIRQLKEQSSKEN